MAKIMSCRDVGFDCGFVAKGETEEDILQQAAPTHVPFTTSMRLLLKLLKRSKAQLRTKRLKPPWEPSRLPFIFRQ
jgi:hypothetical protein